MRHQQKLVTDSTLLLEIYKEYRRDKEKWKTDDPLNVRENPFRGHATLDYSLQETDGYSLTVVNAPGQLVEKYELPDIFGNIVLGGQWSPGVYFVHLERGARIVQTVKLMKL